MIEYIKMLIVAIITGVTAPLPVSSAAHFSFLSMVTGLSSEPDRLSLYYNTFILVFTLVVLIAFRKTVSRGFRLAVSSSKRIPEAAKSRDNKYFIKNIILSLLPTAVLFIPVTKEKLLMDYFDIFLNVNGLILTGFAVIITSFILIIAIWYTSKSKNPLRRAVDKKTVFRLSFYQLPCYIIPGFSHIATGAVNLFISDISARNLAAQLYIYLAPSMFFVSAVKVVRILLSGIIFDPVSLALGAVVFAIFSRFVISLAIKSNFRRLFTFFTVYSVVFGVFVTVISFFI